MTVFGLGDLAFLGAVGGVAYDSDSQTYISAVETADGQSLETAVKDAINAFVVGCKADGIWTAIKASCILAGARTLNGALVPLVGTAPTNNNFVSGDYNRKTGLVGNGTNKYIATNRNENSVPQDSIHLSCCITANFSQSTIILQGLDTSSTTRLARRSIGQTSVYSRNGSVQAVSSQLLTTGFLGMSRNNSAAFDTRYAGTTFSTTATSATPNNANFEVFRSPSYPTQFLGDGRLAFYSIGESLDLAKLDSRVTTLINAFGTAIA